MDLVPYLSAVILIATIATLLLAVFSYAAFELRNSRRPKLSDQAPVFFHRYRLEDEQPAAEPAGQRQGGRLEESADAQRAEGERRRAPAQNGDEA